MSIDKRFWKSGQEEYTVKGEVHTRRGMAVMLALVLIGISCLSGNVSAAGSYTKNTVSGGDAEAVSLRIPQKVDIVIDPWATDGNGQIYSEQYVIKNMGETPGILTLSGLIRNGEEMIYVEKDAHGLHDGSEKSVYMELVLGNGDKIIFSREGDGYEIELEPGEELAFWFAGEVNENVPFSWKSGDFGVAIIYGWEIVGTVSGNDQVGSL